MSATIEDLKAAIRSKNQEISDLNQELAHQITLNGELNAQIETESQEISDLISRLRQADKVSEQTRMETIPNMVNTALDIERRTEMVWERLEHLANEKPEVLRNNLTSDAGKTDANKRLATLLITLSGAICVISYFVL